jgi:pimeloyl-ACP methyl ester carboxylesterase
MPQTPQYEDAFVNVLGTRVHYLHAGAGRPIVLIHGLAASCMHWRRNICALASRASVYAIDLVNMGKSDRIAGLDPSLEATADRVAAMMEALGIGEADIAGSSHGGSVAWMLAARHRERVRSLILFAPANPYSRFGHGLLRVYNTWPGRLAVASAPYLPASVHLYAIQRMYGDPARIPEGCLEAYVSGLKVPGTMKHIQGIVRGWSAGMERLRSVLPLVADVPTLLVWGDRDRAVDPESATALQRILRRSELRVLPGGGHLVYEEMPEVVNPILLEWLSRDVAALSATGCNSRQLA